MSSAADLIGLIDLSLGDKPSGVVNFNYLHCLLHEIVRRLGIYEEQQQHIAPLSSYIQSSKLNLRESTATIPDNVPFDISLPQGVAGPGMESTDTTPAHSSSITIPGHPTAGQYTERSQPSSFQIGEQPPTIGQSSSGSVAGLPSSVPGSDQPSSVPGGSQSSSVPGGSQPFSVQGGGHVPGGDQPFVVPGGGQSSSVPEVGQSSSVQGGGQPFPISSSGQPHSIPGVNQMPSGFVSSGGAGHPSSILPGQPSSVQPGGQPLSSSTSSSITSQSSAVKQQSSSHVPGTSDDDKTTVDGLVSSSGIHGRPSSNADIHRPYSLVKHHRSSVVSAANDLGFLERKLQELETRVNTMETLPELLERKGSDVTATPVRDMWNFTNLNNRVGSVENGIDKTSQLVDDLLGEVQSLKQQLGEVQGSVEKRLDEMTSRLTESDNERSNMFDKMKQLETLKLAASSDSPSDAFMGILGNLQQKVDDLETDSNSTKERVKTLEDSMSDFVRSSEFASLKDSFSELTESTNSKLNTLQGKLEASDYTAEENLKTLSDNMQELLNKFKEVDSAMSQKVNASDLTSLMSSSDGDEGASLLPKLLELQTKFNQFEDKMKKQPSVPSDLINNITTMQNAIDHLSTEVSKLSGLGASSVDVSRIDDVGSQIAQMRERMEEIDRAVGALTNAISEQGVTVQEVDNDYADMESFKGLEQLVQSLQDGQERLLGTAANLSHELEVNQEHVKTLYSAVDDLKAMKVDKDQLAVEVEEKADRSALDGKASREWVDSTFERLDREIREAKSHLMCQEEAFRNAMGQLNEDVEGKLDRLELEPLRQYIDKNLQRIKTAPMNTGRTETLADDAAGFRKPLHFRCISCDKPLGLKSADPIPTLPMSDLLPPTKSFRPYTTYELELIRRHQKIQPGVLGPPTFPVSIRSAGGSHTLTRPKQKIRVTPYPGVVPEHIPARSTPSVFVHDEMDIVGQDGHIYKGRMGKQSLPPLSKQKYGRNRATKVVRPATSTSPLQSVHS